MMATGRLALKKEVTNVELVKKEMNHLNDNPLGGKRKWGEESKDVTTTMTIGAKIKP